MAARPNASGASCPTMFTGISFRGGAETFDEF
jgi:hypothetical protein